MYEVALVNVPMRHGLATRWVHAALALAIGVELITGLIMQGPEGGHPMNGFYRVHRVSDFAVLGLAVAFWMVVALRRGGTQLGVMMPWFSARRLRRLAVEESYREDAPLTAAVRGVELGLVTVMAVSGVLRLGVHEIFSGLVWVAIIGHLLLAMLHHYGIDDGIAEMWSLRRGPLD